MGTFDDWKADSSPDEASVSVCFDRRLYREFADADAALRDAREPGMLAQSDDVEALAAKVVDLKARIAADRVKHTFVFATVPYGRWRALAEKHEPTAQQKADNRYLDFNPETFPQAAVALSCISPELSDEDGEWLREHLPRQEFDRLFEAALQVNVGGSSIAKHVAATVDRLASGLNSITAPSEASPPPSSEDE